MKIELQHISKSFPGIKALQEVNLKIESGRVHAICGENGAGKSTLLNILTGNLQPDEGTILLNEKEIHFSTPKEAFDQGIAIVYQHLSLVNALSVAENIFGNQPPLTRHGFLTRRVMLSGARQLLEKLGLRHLRPEQPVKSLQAGEKQMVEIAKALINNPKIIFFDEPTASVSEKDAEIIFNIIQQLKTESVAVVYISHRMSEIFRLADEITVLKDGKVQGTFPTNTVSEDKLIQLMVGREISWYEGSRKVDPDPMLEVVQISGSSFREISFTLRRGEILGMAGLVGAGRTEIAQAIFGASQITGGSLRLKGKPVHFPAHPSEAIRLGIGYIPEDRKSLGIFEQRSVAENIYISELVRNPAFSSSRMDGLAQRYAEALRIHTPSLHKKAGELSGGNQQKLLIARWLNMNVELLIMDEPTQGIDIGARFEIYRIMREFADSGRGILLISSEMNELMNVCNRIMVIRQGSSMGVLEAEEASEERILSLAMP